MVKWTEKGRSKGMAVPPEAGWLEVPEGDCLLGGLVEVWVAAAFGDLDPAGDAEFGDVDEEADDALGMAAGGGGGVCGGAVVDAGVRAGRGRRCRR